MKQEGLQDRRSETAQLASEMPEGTDAAPVSRLQAGHRNSRRGQFIGELSATGQTEDGWLPARAVEARHQLDQRPLRAAVVQISDAERDANWDRFTLHVVGP